MTEDDHRECQNLVELHAIRCQRFDNTRKIQWNFNAILWAGLVASIAFLFPHRTALQGNENLIVIFGLIIIVAHTMLLYQTIRGLSGYSVSRRTRLKKFLRGRKVRRVQEDGSG